jgi:hypothetical protein
LRVAGALRHRERIGFGSLRCRGRLKLPRGHRGEQPSATEARIKAGCRRSMRPRALRIRYMPEIRRSGSATYRPRRIGRTGGDGRLGTLRDGLPDRRDGHRLWSRRSGNQGIGSWLAQAGGSRTGTGLGSAEELVHDLRTGGDHRPQFPAVDDLGGPGGGVPGQPGGGRARTIWLRGRWVCSRRELSRRLRGPRPRSLGMDPALSAAVEFAC